MLARMILAVLLLASAAGSAAGQRADAAAGWPARPIKMIVPLPQAAAPVLSAAFWRDRSPYASGKPVVIEKRAEGSGMLGSEAGARARPDGYTLGIATSSTHALAPSLSAGPAYDPLRDFAPVSMIGGSPHVMVRSPQPGTTSVQGLVEQAETKPGKLTFGSAAPGSLAHLAPKRTPAIPDLPTIAENGYSRYEAALWMALVAPALSAQPTVAKLNDAIGKSLDDADVKTKLTIQGFEAEPDTPEALRDRIAADIGKWPTVVVRLRSDGR